MEFFKKMEVVEGFECRLRVSWGFKTLEVCSSDQPVETKLKFLEKLVVLDKELELFLDF